MTSRERAHLPGERRGGEGGGGGDARLYCRAVTRYARLGSVRQTGPSFVSDVSQKRRDVERGRTSSLLAAVPVSGNEPCESGIPDNRSRKSPTVREAPHPPSPAPRETLSVLFPRHPRPTGRPLSLSLSQEGVGGWWAWRVPKARELSVACDRPESRDPRQRGWPSIIQAIRPTEGADWLFSRAWKSDVSSSSSFLSSYVSIPSTARRPGRTGSRFTTFLMTFNRHRFSLTFQKGK